MNTAVVTGPAHMDVEPPEKELTLPRFIDVYAKKAEHWQMVAWPSTRLADP